MVRPRKPLGVIQLAMKMSFDDRDGASESGGLSRFIDCSVLRMYTAVPPRRHKNAPIDGMQGDEDGDQMPPTHADSGNEEDDVTWLFHRHLWRRNFERLRRALTLPTLLQVILTTPVALIAAAALMAWTCLKAQPYHIPLEIFGLVLFNGVLTHYLVMPPTPSTLLAAKYDRAAARDGESCSLPLPCSVPWTASIEGLPAQTPSGVKTATPRESGGPQQGRHQTGGKAAGGARSVEAEKRAAASLRNRRGGAGGADMVAQSPTVSEASLPPAPSISPRCEPEKDSRSSRQEGGAKEKDKEKEKDNTATAVNDQPAEASQQATGNVVERVDDEDISHMIPPHFRLLWPTKYIVWESEIDSAANPEAGMRPWERIRAFAGRVSNIQRQIGLWARFFERWSNALSFADSTVSLYCYLTLAVICVTLSIAFAVLPTRLVLLVLGECAIFGFYFGWWAAYTRRMARIRSRVRARQLMKTTRSHKHKQAKAKEQQQQQPKAPTATPPPEATTSKKAPTDEETTTTTTTATTATSSTRAAVSSDAQPPSSCDVDTLSVDNVTVPAEDIDNETLQEGNGANEMDECLSGSSESDQETLEGDIEGDMMMDDQGGLGMGDLPRSKESSQQLVGLLGHWRRALIRRINHTRAQVVNFLLRIPDEEIVAHRFIAASALRMDAG